MTKGKIYQEVRVLAHEIASCMRIAQVHRAGGRFVEYQAAMDKAKRLHTRRNELCK